MRKNALSRWQKGELAQHMVYGTLLTLGFDVVKLWEDTPLGPVDLVVFDMGAQEVDVKWDDSPDMLCVARHVIRAHMENHPGILYLNQSMQGKFLRDIAVPDSYSAEWRGHMDKAWLEVYELTPVLDLLGC